MITATNLGMVRTPLFTVFPEAVTSTTSVTFWLFALHGTVRLLATMVVVAIGEFRLNALLDAVTAADPFSDSDAMSCNPVAAVGFVTVSE